MLLLQGYKRPHELARDVAFLLVARIVQPNINVVLSGEIEVGRRLRVDHVAFNLELPLLDFSNVIDRRESSQDLVIGENSTDLHRLIKRHDLLRERGVLDPVLIHVVGNGDMLLSLSRSLAVPASTQNKIYQLKTYLA
ncbi:MAG: hypothetical protein ACO2OZ_01125 [Acidilobaceae archaeon]|jgi:hypothetical protein